MKRSEHLVPYSNDHQHALAQTARLERAAQSHDPDRLRAEVDQVLAFVEHELAPHLLREETELLPVLNRLGVIRPEEVACVASDHLELRTLHRQLAAQPDDAAVAAAFARRLRTHVCWEERDLFPEWQDRLESTGPTPTGG